MTRLPKAALVACCLVSACASTPDATQSAQPYAEREYRTGSNIRVRDPSAAPSIMTMDREAWERERSQSSGIALPAAGSRN